MATALSNGQTVNIVTIKGRPYVTVAERVRLAHAATDGGYSMLASEIVTLAAAPDRAWVRVTILVDGQQYIGTSEVKLTAKPGTADGDSPLECAETSALGRALGFAGIGLLDSIASAEEVARNLPRARE